MKTAAWILAVVLFVLTVVMIRGRIVADWEYESTISAPWLLADKASTIPQKTKYIDQFVANLEGLHLNDEHSAIFLTTPNNSFGENLAQLKTLRVRLHEIEKMDVTSFQYQTAMQQITAQEQGEAKNMLSVFEGTWIKAHFWYVWNWIGGVIVVLLSLAASADVGLFIAAYEAWY
jgi:hypothetical protein